MSEDAELRRELGAAQAALGQGDLARFAQALARARGHARDPALALTLEIDRAWALADLGERGEALTLARAAGERLMANPSLTAKLGALLDRLEAPEEALPLFRRAAEAEPGRPEVWLDLASVARSVGEVGEAEAACERAIALAPAASAAHALLASLRSWSPERHHVDRLRQVLAAAPPGLERARLGHALFKELDDLGRHDEAWAALSAAAGEAKAVMPWSAARDRALVEALRAPLPAGEGAAAGEPRPIFVVGLPRSGTSLVERVLAAHSQVAPLGELAAFGALAHQALGASSAAYLDPEVAARLGEVDWAGVGRGYRDIARRLAPGAAVTVDKLPQNWLLAGAIARALPDAVIVHVSRGPMDGLFGAYRQLFARDFAWSYALDDLAAHYAHYRGLTGHWREALGPAWVELSYEAVARDPAGEIPKVLERLGLPFEDACLTPHLGEGRARSLSTLQVRAPINTRGIGAWRAYARPLEPLRARLQALGFVDATGEPA